MSLHRNCISSTPPVSYKCNQVQWYGLFVLAYRFNLLRVLILEPIRSSCFAFQSIQHAFIVDFSWVFYLFHWCLCWLRLIAILIKYFSFHAKIFVWQTFSSTSTNSCFRMNSEYCKKYKSKVTSKSNNLSRPCSAKLKPLCVKEKKQ